MVDTPSVGFGQTQRAHQDWINNLSQDQLLPVGKSILTKIAEDPTMRERFVTQIKSDPTLSWMLSSVTTS